MTAPVRAAVRREDGADESFLAAERQPRVAVERREQVARRERDLVRALRASGSVRRDRVERLAPRLGAALVRAADRGIIPIERGL